MSDKNSKELRKTLRQVVKEILPEVMKEELFLVLAKELRTALTDRLNIIDQRQKDIQGYVVRQSAQSIVTKKD